MAPNCRRPCRRFAGYSLLTFLAVARAGDVVNRIGAVLAKDRTTRSSSANGTGFWTAVQGAAWEALRWREGEGACGIGDAAVCQPCSACSTARWRSTSFTGFWSTIVPCARARS
jgi:hypothetical protein